MCFKTWCMFVAGVSLWYDLHGASYAWLEALLVVLAQYPARYSQRSAQRPHHCPFWPHTARLLTAHSKGHQGAEPSSVNTVYFFSWTWLANRIIVFSRTRGIFHSLYIFLWLLILCLCISSCMFYQKSLTFKYFHFSLASLFLAALSLDWQV